MVSRTGSTGFFFGRPRWPRGAEAARAGCCPRLAGGAAFSGCPAGGWAFCGFFAWPRGAGRRPAVPAAFWVSLRAGREEEGRPCLPAAADFVLSSVVTMLILHF